MDDPSHLNPGRSALNVEHSASVDAANPWPGLSTFTEDTRGFFFGRDRETDELSRLVRRETLTVLFGQSGLGKSSLLQAGLFPILRETDHLPLYLRLDHAADAPPLAEQVKAALTAAFVAAKAEAPALGPDETLWEYFHRKDVDIWSAKNRLLTPVLAFDQFEEMFTLGRADDARRDRSRAFLTELADLVENRPPAALKLRFDRGEADPTRFNFDKPSCRVILSLREDFLPDLEGLKQELPALIHNRLRLRRLNGAQALEAVTRPAPHLLAEGVGEKIVEFVAGARGGSVERLTELDVEPALLSVICRELNERRRALGQTKITADLVTGNRREILTNFYERSVADLPAPMRAFVEDHLLTKSGFRDNLALETALDFPGVTRPLIDTLVARRLLRLEDRLGVQRVELTHDVLAEVIRVSRDARQQRLALDEMRQKERMALAAAVRQTRRQRFAIAGLVAVVLALSVGAVFGIRAQRQAADEAARAELATGSRLLDDGKVGDGLAYLVSAAQRERDGGVAAARILTALAARTFWVPLGGSVTVPGPIDSVQPLPGGDFALVLSEDGSLHLLDMKEWKIVREYRFEHQVRPGGVRIAPANGDLFAVALTNGTLLVCDTATGNPRTKPIVPPQRVAALNAWRQANTGELIPGIGARRGGLSLRSRRATQRRVLVGSEVAFALSPDGRWLRTISDSWSIFDTTTGEERSGGDQFHTIHLNDPSHSPFSPDGKRFVTSSSGLGFAGNRISTVATQLQIRSVPDGNLLATFPTESRSSGSRQGLSFSADGKRLMVSGSLAAANTAGIFVYDTETLQSVGPPTLYNFESVRQVWFTPDGKRAIVTADERTATIYDIESGRPAFPPLVHGGPVTCAGLSQDGTILATTSLDGICRLWDLRTGKPATDSTYRQAKPGPASLSADGKQLVVTSHEGQLHRLQGTPGAIAPLVLPRAAPSGALPSLPLFGEFAAGLPARLLWFENRQARSLDIAAGRWVESVRFPAIVSSPNANPFLTRPPYAAALIAGDVLIARNTAAPPRIWRWGESGPVQTNEFADPPGPAAAYTVSASGNLMGAVATLEGSRVLGIWDLRTGRRIAAVPGFVLLGSAEVNWGVSFSPDDRQVAVYEPESGDTPDGIQVYELPSAKTLYRIAADDKTNFRAMRFSADGQRLLTGSSWGSVQVWDAATGKLRQSTAAHGLTVSRIEFSSDGKFYASLAQDGTVQIWDNATDRPVGSVLTHNTAVEHAAFSSDNSRLATAAANGSGRVWDIRSGLPLNDSMEATGYTTATVRFSPDDRYVLAGTPTFPGAYQASPAPPLLRKGRAPKWLLELATMCGGWRLNAEGKLVRAETEFNSFARLRGELQNLPENDAQAEWARWFLSEDPARSIAPHFTVTPAEARKLADDLSAPDPLIAWTAQDNALLLANGVGSEPLERQMLAWVLERDGEGNSVHADHMIKLAQTLVFLGKFEEAEKLARACLALREKVSPGGLPSAKATIGSALVGQERYSEAEPLLVEGCEALRQQDTVGVQNELIRIQTRHRVAKLIELYEATGRPEKAAEWRKWTPRTDTAAPIRAAAPAATTPPPVTTPNP